MTPRFPRIAGVNIMAMQIIEIFVSPSGPDSGDGSPDAPFSSCARARDAVRAALAAGARDVRVHLATGVYRLEETLALDARDGSPHGSVRWIGEAGRNAISGAQIAPQPEVLEDGRWRIALPGLGCRQLVVNGRRALPARWPETGAFRKIAAWLPDTKEILIEAPALPKGAGSEIELVVFMAWAEAIVKLESVTRTDAPEYDWTSPLRLKLREPEASILFRRSFPIKKNSLPFFWQFDPVLVTRPGEWSPEPGGAFAIYQPRPGETPAEALIEIPVLETLLDLCGMADSPIVNVKFEGIAFTGTTWRKPSSSGVLNLQAGMFNLPATQRNEQFVGRPPAAVQASFCKGLRFEGCEFFHTGSTALDLHRGVADSGVSRCAFHDLGGGGISIGVFSEPDQEMHAAWTPSDPGEITRRITIADNTIERVGLDYPGTCGVGAGFVRETVIEHNRITDVPYCGISLGWGWTCDPSPLGDNHIRRNRIARAMTRTLDGGAIYTLSSMPGSTIEANHITDIRTEPNGIGARSYAIYLDEGSDGITVSDNLIQGIEHGNHHKFNPCGRITIEREGSFGNAEVEAQAGPRQVSLP